MKKMEMNETGIVRRIDDLGRIVIPREIRRSYRIKEGDAFELYIASDESGAMIGFKQYFGSSILISRLEEAENAMNRTKVGTFRFVTAEGNLFPLSKQKGTIQDVFPDDDIKNEFLEFASCQRKFGYEYLNHARHTVFFRLNNTDGETILFLAALCQSDEQTVAAAAVGRAMSVLLKDML